MSARITINRVAVGQPGDVGLQVASVASDNEPLTDAEIVSTLKSVIARIEAGTLESSRLPLTRRQLPGVEELAKAMLAGFQGGKWIPVGWDDIAAKTREQLLGEAAFVRALVETYLDIGDDATVAEPPERLS